MYLVKNQVTRDLAADVGFVEKLIIDLRALSAGEGGNNTRTSVASPL